MARTTKKLLIVESPAKVKTISTFLGPTFKVMSTAGHIKDLPEREVGVQLADTIELTYTTLEKKDRTIADLRKEARTATEIFLAPDPDREGEIIAFHVAQEVSEVTGKDVPLYRIAFHEITKTAVETALAQPGSINMHKVGAQQARRVLDRWVGYEVSPILWRKIKKGLSAGRVQSVALRLICDREAAIRIFKPEESWSIHGTFSSATIVKLLGTLTHQGKKKVEPKTAAEAEELKKALLALKQGTIHQIKDTKRTRQPVPPFMTSTLQQSAYNQLGFSVDKTMQLAQKLYEGVQLSDATKQEALITYMRTDSVRIATSAQQATRTYIKQTFGTDYAPEKAPSYAKKGQAQDAHEAIRPIDVTRTPESVSRFLERDMARLYELIWKRFVASQMKAAVYAQRAITIHVGAYILKASGSTLVFDGYLRVYAIDEEGDEGETGSTLPEGLAEGDVLSLQAVDAKQHFTQPPPRFTQASLVKELEKDGIGRPSTYAAILKTIQARAYTTLDEKKRFVPTELGMAVTAMLVEHLPHIMQLSFTARMEEDLDKVAAGELERDRLLRDFYAAFHKDLDAWSGTEGRKPAEILDLVCPSCGKANLAIRFGKNGAFAGCTAFPECTFTSQFKRHEDGQVELIEQQLAEIKLLEELCPNCGKQLRTVNGRFGSFIACSGYPECTYIHKKKARFACPSCGGNVVENRWKGKTFWGCSNYPTCKFSISGDIEDTTCPSCSSLYRLKRTDSAGETYLICPNKECKTNAARPAA